MSRSSRKQVEETKGRVLAYIYQKNRASGDAPPIARRDMVNDLGISHDQARFACRALESSGFIFCEPRFGENGGQLANAYRITAAGLRALGAGLMRIPGHETYRIQVLKVRLGTVIYMATKFTQNGCLETLEMHFFPKGEGRALLSIRQPGTSEPVFEKYVDTGNSQWERCVQMYFKTAFERDLDVVA